MADPIASFLADGLTLLDGGVGEELNRRGVQKRYPSLGSANALFTAPGKVQSVHEDYLRAGADIITTNTYATPRERLAEVGLGDRVEELNQRAGRLAERARAAVDREAWIAGSLPPIRGSYRPDLVGDIEEIEPQYREQAQLLAPHVDIFICETMSSVQEARAAAAGARATGKPVLVSYTIDDEPTGDGALEETDAPRLRSGESLAEAVASLPDLQLSGLLLNCSPPERIGAALPILNQQTDRPVGGYANAFTGIPDAWNEKTDPSPPGREDLDPAAYADQVRRWIEAGARIVGGCCRIGPEHIARLRTVVSQAASTQD